MKQRLRVIIFLALITDGFLNAQSEGSYDCAFLQDCKLELVEPGGGSAVTIKDTLHTELVEGGKYYIKSRLEWLSDCEYNATVIYTNWPEFYFPIGTVMNTKVVKIKRRTITMAVNVEGLEIEVVYKRIE